MATETWMNDAGTGRQIREVWINDAGTARRIQEIWTNDNGTARRIFVGDQIVLANMFCASVNPGGTATAQYQLRNTGDIFGTTNSNIVVDRNDWIAPKINMGNYSARATFQSGDLPSGTFGSWLNLGTTRGWSLTGSLTFTQGTFLIEIRRDSDGAVLNSATITLDADGSPN